MHNQPYDPNTLQRGLPRLLPSEGPGDPLPLIRLLAQIAARQATVPAGTATTRGRA